MLSISQPIRSAAYYLSLAKEDYYLTGGEPQGLWRGEGAHALGLSGPVEKAELRALFSGRLPDGTGRLVQNADSRARQSGWDLTFSAPKSVSVFWSQAAPEIRRLVQEAQQGAVDATLSYLESCASLTRRGKGGAKVEPARAIFATFEHGTSRAQDPQLHTHALLLNIGIRADGTAGSLVSREFFRQKMLAGAIYRTELAHELRKRIGLRVRGAGHAFEIIGVPEKLCEKFSTRRKEIEAELARRNRSSAVAAKIAALETRRAKAHLPREKLFEVWRAAGKELGWSTTQASALVRKHKREPEKVFRHDFETTLLMGAAEWKTPLRLALAALRLSVQQGKSAEEVLRIVDSCLEKKGMVQVRHKLPFWRAPAWSPLRKLKVPFLAFSWQSGIRRRFGPSLAQLKTPVGKITLRKKFLFPNAPTWSPARRLSLPVLDLSPKAPAPFLKQDEPNRITR